MLARSLTGAPIESTFRDSSRRFRPAIRHVARDVDTPMAPEFIEPQDGDIDPDLEPVVDDLVASETDSPTVEAASASGGGPQTVTRSAEPLERMVAETPIATRRTAETRAPASHIAPTTTSGAQTVNRNSSPSPVSVARPARPARAESDVPPITEAEPEQVATASTAAEDVPVNDSEPIPAQADKPRDPVTAPHIGEVPREVVVPTVSPVSLEQAVPTETEQGPVVASVDSEAAVSDAVVPESGIQPIIADTPTEVDSPMAIRTPLAEPIETRPSGEPRSEPAAPAPSSAPVAAPATWRESALEPAPATGRESALEPVIAASETRALDEPADNEPVSQEPVSADEIQAIVDAPAVDRSAQSSAAAISEEVVAPNRVEIRRSRRPRPTQSPPPETRASDSLFVDTSGDRSPQSWIERLVDVVRQERAQDAERRGEATAQPTAPFASPIEQPDRPSETTRRFLTPIVGIDPADVPIHRGVEASRIAVAHGADAVTTGGEVFVAAGFPEDTVEGLGLLAHELTHVVRNRQARFVPPVIAPTPARPAAVATREETDEESVALQVEQQVRSEAARAEHARQVDPFAAANTTTNLTFRPPVSARAQSDAPSVQPAAIESTSRPTESGSADDDWGGLPTPWEPMPDWLAPAPSPINSATPHAYVTRSGAPSANAPLASMAMPATATASSTAAAVQTAATDRSTASHDSPAPASATGGDEHAGPVEPDLDALARQVYGVLRRRLAAERRRLG